MTKTKIITAEQYRKLKKGNRKVMGAKKQYDEHGNLLADSAWELRCLRIMQYEGLDNFEVQKEFELLPTIRGDFLPRTLRKRVWKVDFAFEDLKIVGDAKGCPTEIARLKVHLFLYMYPQWEVYLIKDRYDLMNFVRTIKERRKL